MEEQEKREGRQTEWERKEVRTEIGEMGEIDIQTNRHLTHSLTHSLPPAFPPSRPHSLTQSPSKLMIDSLAVAGGVMVATWETLS